MSLPILLTDHLQRCTLIADYGQFMTEYPQPQVQLAIAAGLRHGLNRFGDMTVGGGFPRFASTGVSVNSMLGPVDVGTRHVLQPPALKPSSEICLWLRATDLASVRAISGKTLSPTPCCRPRRADCAPGPRSARVVHWPRRVHGVPMAPRFQPARTSTGPRFTQKRTAHTPGTE